MILCYCEVITWICLVFALFISEKSRLVDGRATTPVWKIQEYYNNNNNYYGSLGLCRHEGVIYFILLWCVEYNYGQTSNLDVSPWLKTSKLFVWLWINVWNSKTIIVLLFQTLLFAFQTPYCNHVIYSTYLDRKRMLWHEILQAKELSHWIYKHVNFPRCYW